MRPLNSQQIFDCLLSNGSTGHNAGILPNGMFCVELSNGRSFAARSIGSLLTNLNRYFAGV